MKIYVIIIPNLNTTVEEQVTRKQYKSNRNTNEEKSFADHVSSASKRLVKLAQSEQVSDRFRALNTLIFILVLGFIIAHIWMYPDSLWSLSGFVVLLFSLIASLFVGVYGYISFLCALPSRNSDEVETLKIGTIILLIAYPLSFSGLVFGIRWLIFTAFGLIPIQALVLIVCSMFSLVPSVEKKQTEGMFGGTTGKISLTVTVVDIIVTLTSIIISTIQLQ